MNAVDMPSDAQELVARLVALRDALVGSSQVLRDLQFQIDREGRMQAEDSVEQMLARFAAQPVAGNAGPAGASQGHAG